MKEHEVEKTILAAPDAKSNEIVREAFEKYPEEFLPLVWLNPISGEDEAAKLKYYVKDCGFVGVKMHPLFDAFVADSEPVNPIMEAAQELQVPVFIHCGHPPFSLPWSIALLAERYPAVPVVMIHMGHGHGVYIDASIAMAMRYDNLYLEMSGMPMPSKIYEAYHRVGSERILFGTDQPFHPPSVEIQKVLSSGLTEEHQKDVFYENAKKLMKI
jgi:predicted TIM-barrel fold metal-dependent hydrolase